MSAHREKPTERGALTSWRHQREGLVSTQEDTDRARLTHTLETAEGRTCQDRERNRPNEVHSLPGDGKGRSLSVHGKKLTERGILTNWKWQREVLVKAQKETDQARRTYSLETGEGGTCQDTERNRPSKAHSPSGDSRGEDLSGHGEKPTEQGALTNWRWQREGLLRTWKETDRARHTHFLEM